MTNTSGQRVSVFSHSISQILGNPPISLLPFKHTQGFTLDSRPPVPLRNIRSSWAIKPYSPFLWIPFVLLRRPLKRVSLSLPWRG